MNELLQEAFAAFAAGELHVALAYAKAASDRPDANQALVLMVNAATRLGEVHEARYGLERLHAAFPENHQYRRMLATALNKLGLRAKDPVEARTLFEEAVTVAPDAAEPVFNLAELLLKDGLEQAIDGDIEVAADIFERTSEIAKHGEFAPGLRAEIAARLVLEPVHDSVEAIHIARARYAAGLAELRETFDAPRVAQCAKSLDQLVWSNFLLAYQGENDLALQSQYGDWVCATAAQLAPQIAAPSANANPKRIGFVSSFFRESTVGAYFGSWIDALTQAGFETHVFALGPLFDATTDAICGTATHSTRLSGSLDAIASAVRDADCGVIVYPELGMDARTFALAALRLAPVQAMAWGHPVTSGLPSIDVYFTASDMEPTDFASHYRERVIALPGLGTAYRMPEPPPELDRAALGLPEGRLYLVPQAAFKIHPDNDAVLADVLARDPQARIVLFDNERAAMTERLKRRFEKTFVATGVDPARVAFLPMTSRARYLAINRACDVMIDSLHWSGGNTTLDALSVGLPVVTTAGRMMRGRQSAAMLEQLGLSAPLVVQPQTIASRAVEVARDSGLRAQLNETARVNMPTLVEGNRALGALVAAFERGLVK